MKDALALKHFPWLDNLELVIETLGAWQGLCEMDTPAVPGQSISYRDLLDMIMIVDYFFKHSKTQNVKGLGPALFDRHFGFRKGGIPWLLGQITAVGQTENPHVSCPILVISALTITAFWNTSSSLSTWAEADQTIAKLAAAQKLINLVMHEPKWKCVNANTFQGWVIPEFTRDFVRRKLLCSLNEFDVGMSGTCKQTVFGLRKVVRELIGGDAGNDFLLCGGGGMHGGTMPIFQSLIASASSSTSKTHCEVGFNYGMSAAVALCMPGVRVFSWDLASDPLYIEDHPVSAFAAGYLKARFPDSFRITFGDSRVTLPGAGEVLGRQLCSSIFIDGDHVPEAVRGDLLSFMNVSAPGAVFIIDDCWLGNVLYKVAEWAMGLFRFTWDFESTLDGHCILWRNWTASESPWRP